MRFLFVILALVALNFGISHADYMDYNFRVHCDAANNRAEIIPYAVWNTEVYSAFPQDCVLANGRTIRVKMGLGPVRPYGMGGGIPPKWLSVWIDKAKVSSRLPFICYPDEEPCSIRVVVTEKGMEVCRREEPSCFLPVKSPKDLKESCDFTPNENLLTERDPLEFPTPNEKRRPSAGTFVTLFAKEEQFCRQFQSLSPSRRLEDSLPDNAEVIEEESMSPYEYSGRYNYYTFDINNDGKKEKVVGLHSRIQYRDGDIYFVYTGDTAPNPAVDKLKTTPSETGYAKSASRILPHYWSDDTEKNEKELADKDIDDGFYRVKNVTAPWWDPDDTPNFRFRYWHLLPFCYEDSTFFLTGSQEAGKKHWFTVLRPEPNYQVTEMCVFQVVQEHY